MPGNNFTKNLVPSKDLCNCVRLTVSNLQSNVTEEKKIIQY